ncbi:hypothetical protein AAE485_14270 (plasmid) [Acidithiobacillus ferriphilus]|uniref:hypothetical protein n=1 Tax=Acidithiobacillus TaxID=119977 RepID=UPI0034E5462C
MLIDEIKASKLDYRNREVFMTTENRKLKIEDIVVYVAKMYMKPGVRLWELGILLLLLLITAAVVIWVPSGAGWTPLVSAVFIGWVSFAGIQAVLLFLGVWGTSIVDRRTHVHRDLP